MQTKIHIQLLCGSCGYQNEIDPTDIEFGFALTPCGDHGHHASVAMVMECPNCGKENAVEIKYSGEPE